MDLCPSSVAKTQSVVPLKVEIFVAPSASEMGMWQVSTPQRLLKLGV
jgi:hypothetical protein